MKKMTPKVSIIILNWNGKEDTTECLESLKRISYSNYEIILVDNGSSDGSVEFLKERYPQIEIIENGRNLGFAEGNNVGIKKAIEKGTEYVLLLNNDTIVDPKFLGELVKVAESNPKIGIAGPKTYYYDYNGRKDIINFAGGKFDIWKGESYHIGINEIDTGQYDEIRVVDYVEGSCLLAKKEMIEKVGLLNPVYFVYWEENDLCLRASRAGYKSVYAPGAKIWHKVTSSTPNQFAIYLRSRNIFILIKMHSTKLQFLSFFLYFFLFQFWFKSAIFLIYHRDLKSFKSFFKGTFDGVKKVIK